MINLESLDIDKDTKEVRADFGGFLEDGFYIKCDIDWTEEVEPEEEENGRNEALIISDVTFWSFVIYNSANDPISFSNQLEREAKQEIENEIINQLQTV